MCRVSLGKGYSKRSPTSWVTFFIMATMWSLSLICVFVTRRESSNPTKPLKIISNSFKKTRRINLLQRLHCRFLIVTRRGGNGLRGGRGKGRFAITLFLRMLSPPHIRNGESHADAALSAEAPSYVSAHPTYVAASHSLKEAECQGSSCLRQLLRT